MKPKAKTLLERHGFKDPDRSTIKHDEIQLWSYNNIIPILNSIFSSQYTFEVVRKELEHPIVQESGSFKSIIGFLDIFALLKVTSVRSGETRNLYVFMEIKSDISSCGELIRQINFYRKFSPSETVWIVVSPNDKFSSILVEQGIKFHRFHSPSQLF